METDGKEPMEKEAEDPGRIITLTEVEREALSGALERANSARAKAERISRTILEAHGVTKDEYITAEDEAAGKFRVLPRAPRPAPTEG